MGSPANTKLLSSRLPSILSMTARNNAVIECVKETPRKKKLCLQRLENWLEFQYHGEIGMVQVQRLSGLVLAVQTSHSLPTSVSELTSYDFWDLLTRLPPIQKPSWHPEPIERLPHLAILASSMSPPMYFKLGLFFLLPVFCKTIKLHETTSMLEHRIWANLDLCSKMAPEWVISYYF